MPMEELLDDIAKLAAGVNHAVDAAKTGSMTPLPEDLKKKYGGSPYFVRYKKKVAKRWETRPYTSLIRSTPIGMD